MLIQENAICFVTENDKHKNYPYFHTSIHLKNADQTHFKEWM